jgi:glycosyltransferase involved in cell wall biosynthesis
MKVLVVVEQSVPSRYWEASLPLLRENGVDAALATVRCSGELHSNLKNQGIPTFALDAETGRDYLSAAGRLSHLVRAQTFDVIHACESIPAFVTGVSAFWGHPARRIFNRQHNVASGKQRLLSFLGSQMSHLVMPVSRSSGEAAQKYDWVKAEKIKVAYSGIKEMRAVTDDEINQIRSELGIPQNGKVISMVAHLREEKGHLTLFEAGEIVASKTDSPLHVVLAGTGDFEPRLRQAAAESANVTTHFVGHQTDVALWFSVGDVVAMPSHHEAFGLSAVEAMSCGRPLVASNVGGLAEIVENGKSGILFEPEDSEELADELLRVLASPELAANLGENARKRVHENFTMETMVQGWIDCYESVLRSA